MPGTSLCMRSSSLVRADRPHADEHRDRPAPPMRSRNASSGSRSKRICVIAKRAPAATLRRKRSASRPRSSAVGLTATPGKNDVGASIARPWKSSPRLSLRHQLDEPDRVDVVHAVRAGVVAGLGRVARDGEDVAHAFRMRAEQDRLEPGDRRVARRQVRDRLDAGVRARSRRRHDPAHARARARVVVHVDELRLARLADRMRRRDQRLGIRAERRIELHGDDERPRRRAGAAAASARSTAGTRRDRLALAHEERARRCAFSSTAARIAAICAGVVPQQPPMMPRRARAPAPRTRAKYSGVACGKTIRCPDMLASPTFGSTASTLAGALHLGERAQRRRGPAPWFAPKAASPSARRPLARRVRRDACERLAAPRRSHQRDDGERARPSGSRRSPSRGRRGRRTSRP